MTRILAHYHIGGVAADIEARAAALALEQSIEMPLTAVASRYVRDEVVARVANIRALGPALHEVTLAIATATVGRDIGQLMNMLFGNCSLQDDVVLHDVELPATLLSHWRGPRHGLAGLRTLVGAGPRALTMTALKPQGLPATELAQLAATFADAGIDIIKDDHGIADQDYAPFAARVVACQQAVARANAARGGHSVYAPTLSGGPRQLAAQAHIVREEGVRMVLACPLLMGLPVFDELLRHELDCAVLAHPALGGAARIAPPLLFGKLFRMLGADATVFPNHGGRFSYSPATCQALAQAALAPWHDYAPCAPVPAGGMSVERVAEMLDFYGRDVILLIGGALLAAGDALPARAREFVSRVHAATL
ncbi:MAG: ribulose 1,5-bisphosphate carboxylase [Gammaproteobacteria bacterium]|nr:ribulose 1,5-bisphosphate carboxylase [Gammaproteobacteria bacterium]